MNEPPDSSPFMRALEWLAALIGAANCLAVPILFIRPGSGFPFPALYLAEIALIGLLILYYVFARYQLDPRWDVIPWVAAGIILAFVILGGFSIGPYLIPALIAFTALGVLIEWETDGLSIVKNLGLLIAAAVAQGLVMIGMSLVA